MLPLGGTLEPAHIQHWGAGGCGSKVRGTRRGPSAVKPFPRQKQVREGLKLQGLWGPGEPHPPRCWRTPSPGPRGGGWAGAALRPPGRAGPAVIRRYKCISSARLRRSVRRDVPGAEPDRASARGRGGHRLRPGSLLPGGW